MELFTKLVTSLGDPILAAAVLLGVWEFWFKAKKIVAAAGVVVAGGVVYYIMHNMTTVLQSFGSLSQAVLNFFTSLFS